MDFGTAIKTCFKKYATFEGRAIRSEFWYWCLFSLLLGACTAIIDVGILGYSADAEFTPINSIATVVTFLPGIAVTARRLHDVGKSGWWMLLTFTIIGLIPLIIWYANEGEKKKNQYGNMIKIK